MAEESTAAAGVPPAVAAQQEPAASAAPDAAAPVAAAAAAPEPKPQEQGGQQQVEQEAMSSSEPAVEPAVVACQVPPRRFTPDGKVTSVDLTPDGAYVIVGCSDGTIRLYAMAEPGWGCEGAILGQIHAKGLITNLIFHVEVTDDGRFAFAGVLRGSVEMFAYDLTRLPPGQWAENGTPIPPPRRLSRAQAEGLIECHTNLDPKLRGFGAVARVECGEDAAFPEYRLICGLGIKNLHIWRFQEGAGLEGTGEPLWECIYDLVSSGMSIELLAIRPGGLEAVSKACGQNLRVWDLANATDATKCPYVDVLNTQDTRAVFGSFAFGGEGQLSLVRLDLCRQLNRMELPLPSSTSSAAGGAGRSKRRALCSVKDVVGTHGGGGGSGSAQNGPVLVICSDGGVHCYEDGGAASATGKLVPVHSLTVEEDDDVAFTLAAVGGGRTPVVMQTRWSSQENRGEILVEPLRLREGKDAALALRRKALAELEAGGGKPSSASGRHSTGGVKAAAAAAAAAGKENVPVADDEASATTAAPAAAAAAGGKKKRRAKSSPPLVVVPPLVLEEAGGPGSKSHSAPPTASPREGGGKPTPRSVSASKAAAAKAAAAAAAAAAEALPEGLVACRAQPVPRRGAGGQGAGVGMLPRGQEQAPYNPGKRKHFDPFAAAFSTKSSFHAGLNGSTGQTSSKRGKPLSYLALSMAAGGVGSGDGMPRAMRDVETRRVVEDGAGKTAEFFKERVARQEALRDMRVAMEVERGRLAHTTEPETPQGESGGSSVVRSWAELRAKHQGEREALQRKFRAEHDWVRERFLEAVERERLTFHVNKHALPSQVRDPIGFLWWHNARLPLKKQWGRFRSFPQQTAEVLALQGLPDVGARRFSLTSVLANYKDLAARTVKRQQAEADALAALQGMDLPFAHVRPLKVEYPYSGDWAVHDPVGAAVAESRRREQDEAAEGMEEEEGEGNVDDVLVPAEEEVAAAPAVAVAALAVPPPAGGEEEKQPDSPALSVTEGQQQEAEEEEARRASFDPAMDVEEGKVSVSPVPVVEQQEVQEEGVCDKEEEDEKWEGEGKKKVMEGEGGEAKASMKVEA